MKNINMLGSGKIIFAALAPAILEHSKMNVLCVTRNPSLIGINKCVISPAYNFEYPILVANKKEHSLSVFHKSMEQKGIRTGIIHNNEQFIDLIKSENRGIWFSACREGLYKTYLPIMEPYIKSSTHIFVFDNDETITHKAKEVCKNQNIKIHKCIIHSVCNKIDYNYTEKTMHLECGAECLIVFPPDALNLKKLFKSKPIFGRAELKFTTSNEAFHFYSMWKPLGINAMHTLAAVTAYMNGIEKGLSLQEISQKNFSELTNQEKITEYISNIYSILYNIYLAPYEKTVDTDKDICMSITQDFIQGLYNRDESIGRALNPFHSSFDYKIKQHFSLLKSSKDEETINILDKFINLL